MAERLITPTQLALFSRSPVIGAWWEELKAQGLFKEQRPETTPLDDLLFKQGHQHEEVLLEWLEAEGKDVYRHQPVEKEGPPQEEDYAKTKDAMRQGRQYIHQAALKNAEIRGWADLLERIEKPSALGDWSYIPIECKLSSHPKPIYLVQACAYCELLEPILGERPEHFKLYLGGRRFELGEHGYPVERFWSWYEQLRQRYRNFRAAFDSSQEPDDEPGDHGQWEPFIEERLKKKRDVILVAGLSGSQRDKLKRAGIHTIEQLAALPEQSRVPGVNSDILQRLREQAAIQLETRADDERPAFRMRLIEEQGRGLALLPSPDEGDIWFDMEGYPDPIRRKKLEYLFGACYRDPAGDLKFMPWWAHNMAEEKQAFDSFVQWIEQRRLRHPNLHVYHYASYEKTALGNLAALHQIHEPLMDQWRAKGVLVDLYPIVRRGLLLGAESYSIKKVERLYQPPREGDVETAADSVVQYAEWLRSGEPSIAGDLPHGSPRLQAIELYNRDDCISTARLHDFLIEQHRKLQLEFPSASKMDDASANGAPLEDAVEESPRARANREVIESLMRSSQTLLEELPEQHRVTPAPIQPGEVDSRLLALGEADEAAGPRGLSLRIQRLLSQLLPFHVRERKVEWWEFFARLELPPEERLDDPEVIVAAKLEGVEPRQLPKSRQRLLTYSFDRDQPLKLNDGAGLSLYLTEAGISLDADLDEEAGLVILKLPESREQKRLKAGLSVSIPEQSDLVLSPPDISQHLRPHLAAQAARWLEGADLPAAMVHLLERRRMPELEPINARTRRDPASTASDLAGYLANANGVALSLQGPPGSGKTTVTAELIAQLTAQGLRIAVSSNSHPAINHLLKQCQKAVDRLGGKARVVKCMGTSARVEDEEAFRDSAVCCALQKQLRPEMDVVGGTVFVFAKHDDAPFDLLVIDEAGQVSLANLLAMARCARNILVVGDQQQLSQPIRAAHPDDSGLSCLEYVMSGQAVVPPDRGVFLATSWRMPPVLTGVVSELFYEGQLQASSANEANRILWSGQHQGLVFKPVEHKGNSTGSDEEVVAIAMLVEQLLGKPYQRVEMRNGQMTTEDGVIAPNDILITAPYNIQVNRLKRVLGERARIGTVDKFQGQEAPVAIHSLTASDGESAPRGLDFLLDPHRLNVAISRAQCLSIVVGSPHLATGISNSINNVEQLNRLCRLMQSPQACEGRGSVV
jgi:uncharacterized protein